MSYFQSIFAGANDSADVYDDWYQIDIDLEGFEPEVSKWWNLLTPEQKRIAYPFTLYNDGDLQFLDVIPGCTVNFEIMTRKDELEKHKDCDDKCQHDGIGIYKEDKGWFGNFQPFMTTEPMKWGEAKWWQDRKAHEQLPLRFPLPPAFYRKFCHLEPEIRERIVEKYVCTKGYVPQPPTDYDDDDNPIDSNGDPCPSELPNWKDEPHYNTPEIQKILKLGNKFHDEVCSSGDCIKHG